MLRLLKTIILAAMPAVMGPGLLVAATINADISANQSYTFSENLSPDDQLVFEFTVLETLDIETFSISGTDSNEGTDLAAVTFDYNDTAGDTFDTILAVGPVGAAIDFFAGWGPFEVGDIIIITINDGILDPVGITLSFETENGDDVPAVPLPASGWLLGLGLLGAGLVLRRRLTTQT